MHESKPLYPRFPLKSPADAKALAEQLPPLMPEFFKAEDTIGTIHYSRFTVLSEKTLLFLGDFDGEFAQLMAALAAQAGLGLRRDFRARRKSAAHARRRSRRRLRRMDRGASSSSR